MGNEWQPHKGCWWKGRQDWGQPVDQARVWDASSWQHLDHWERVKGPSVDCEPLRQSVFNTRTFFSEMDASLTTSFKALDSKASLFSGIRPLLTVEHLVNPNSPQDGAAFQTPDSELLPPKRWNQDTAGHCAGCPGALPKCKDVVLKWREGRDGRGRPDCLPRYHGLTW